MDRETMIMLALPIVVLIVGGFAAYFVFSRKKPKSAPAPQDNEDDWDYDHDLPEEDDDMSEEGGVK
jgi:flagellar basal body-associated protein FliL